MSRFGRGLFVAGLTGVLALYASPDIPDREEIRSKSKLLQTNSQGSFGLDMPRCQIVIGNYNRINRNAELLENVSEPSFLREIFVGAHVHTKNGTAVRQIITDLGNENVVADYSGTVHDNRVMFYYHKWKFFPFRGYRVDLYLGNEKIGSGKFGNIISGR